MTVDKHRKQLVRARMAATGESYSVARERVTAALSDVRLDDPVVVDVHGRHGQTVTFTPDGTRILSGGQDARVAILDAASGVDEGELLGHGKVVNAVAVTAGTVVSCSSDRTVRLWDLATRAAVAVLEGHRDAVVALDVSPDGRTVVTGGYDGRLRVWDLADHSCIREIRSELRRIAAVVHTPDGRHLVESGQGPVVTVRDARTGEAVTSFETGSPAVVGLAVAPDGAMLAAAGYDGTVTLWDCDGWEPVRRMDGGDRVAAVTFSRAGDLLAAAVKGRVVVWGPDREEPLAEAALGISGVYGLAMSPDTRRLAQTGADGRVRIWTLR